MGMTILPMLRDRTFAAADVDAGDADGATVLRTSNAENGMSWWDHIHKVINNRKIIVPNKGLAIGHPCGPFVSGGGCGSTIKSDTLFQLRHRQVNAVVSYSARDHTPPLVYIIVHVRLSGLALSLIYHDRVNRSEVQ